MLVSTEHQQVVPPSPLISLGQEAARQDYNSQALIVFFIARLGLTRMGTDEN